jgi:hypothetical protein
MFVQSISIMAGCLTHSAASRIPRRYASASASSTVEHFFSICQAINKTFPLSFLITTPALASPKSAQKPAYVLIFTHPCGGGGFQSSCLGSPPALATVSSFSGLIPSYSFAFPSASASFDGPHLPTCNDSAYDIKKIAKTTMEVVPLPCTTSFLKYHARQNMSRLCAPTSLLTEFKS